MVKFIPLGGVAEVTKNMFIYETDRDILIVDCGAGFPDEETENKLLIPNFSYLHSTKKKIRGVIISHAHFDHYGALSYFLSQFNVPIFSSRLVLEFVKEKLKEAKINKKANLYPLRIKERLSLGDFKITPFFVNHSVPDALAFCLETPVGKIFHVSDYKFDLTPVDNRIFDFSTCIQLAKSGVLALCSDCLGASENGFTQTEKIVGKNLHQLMEDSKGQIFVTTLSSNISRIRQIIEAAQRLGRQVIAVGHSMENSIRIAQKLQYLKKTNKQKPLNKKYLDENKVVYLVAGSYGQSNSALTRIAQGKHPQISLKKGAVIIFSADPSPPNTRDKVNQLVDLLTIKGARVHYYEMQENLHVSGHGSAGDIKLLFALIKPKFFIPIGGCPRHMRAYSLLAQSMNIEESRIFELLPGETLVFNQGKVEPGSRIKLEKRVVLV